jgi:hypothetical protein
MRLEDCVKQGFASDQEDFLRGRSLPTWIPPKEVPEICRKPLPVKAHSGSPLSVSKAKPERQTWQELVSFFSPLKQSMAFSCILLFIGVLLLISFWPQKTSLPNAGNPIAPDAPNPVFVEGEFLGETGSLFRVEKAQCEFPWQEILKGSGVVLSPNGVRITLRASRFSALPGKIFLSEGLAEINVPRPGTPFTVSTPNVEVEVRGTRFSVSFQPVGISDIVVFSGKVFARASSGQSRWLLAGDKVRVQGGEILALPVPVPPVTNPPDTAKPEPVTGLPPGPRDLPVSPSPGISSNSIDMDLH